MKEWDACFTRFLRLQLHTIEDLHLGFMHNNFDGDIFTCFVVTDIHAQTV